MVCEKKVHAQVYQSEDNFSINSFKVRKKMTAIWQKQSEDMSLYTLFPLYRQGTWRCNRSQSWDSNLVFTLSKCPHFKDVVLVLVLALNASTDAVRCSQDIKDTDFQRCPKNSISIEAEEFLLQDRLRTYYRVLPRKVKTQYVHCRLFASTSFSLGEILQKSDDQFSFITKGSIYYITHVWLKLFNLRVHWSEIVRHNGSICYAL